MYAFFLQLNICIVYHVPMMSWDKIEMGMYVNGKLKKMAVMKAPNFSDVRIA